MILVTGASGNVGRAVVEELRRRGAAFAAPDRTALDLTRPDTFAGALRGITGVFLMRPPALARMAETLVPFVDRALDGGVERIVFLSVMGAERSRWVPHRAVEDHLVAVAPRFALLRPGFFAQNLGDAYVRDIREDGRLYVPAGAGRVSFVDVRDVAEVAATALVTGAHDRQAYTLTGGEALGFEEVARILSRELGRPIRYQPASVTGYTLHLRRRGLPAARIAVQTLLHLGLRRGDGARIDETLGALLGRRPRTIADYVHDHRTQWTNAGPASSRRSCAGHDRC
jgi:uncharacterized protein YbjT (DUF2867 family)